jgi:hypothetical protein
MKRVLFVMSVSDCHQECRVTCVNKVATAIAPWIAGEYVADVDGALDRNKLEPSESTIPKDASVNGSDRQSLSAASSHVSLSVCSLQLLSS